jgi:ABC-type branched-subunit amino acid transport system ATPase component
LTSPPTVSPRPWSPRSPACWPASATRGLAILLVEQDLRTAFAVADDITVLAKGEIVHRSPTPEFRRNAPLASRLLGV